MCETETPLTFRRVEFPLCVRLCVCALVCVCVWVSVLLMKNALMA